MTHMSLLKRVPFMILTIALILVVSFWPRPGITNSGQASVAWLSAQDTKVTDGFARVTAPEPLEFPRDRSITLRIVDWESNAINFS